MPDFDALKVEAHRYGWFKVAYRILMDRLQPVIRLYQISSRSLDAATPPTETPADEIRFATREDLVTAAQQIPEELSVEFIDQALGRGDQCLAAFKDNMIVSFGWRAYGGDAPHTSKIWVRVRPPYRYGYKSYTRPEFRGLHIMDARRHDSECISRGFTKGISFIETHNLPSLRRSWRRADKDLIGYAGHINLFGTHFFFRTPGVRRAGFEFYLREEAKPASQ